MGNGLSEIVACNLKVARSKLKEESPKFGFEHSLCENVDNIIGKWLWKSSYLVWITQTSPLIFEKFTSRTQNEFHLSYHCHQAIAGKAVDEGVSFCFHCFYLFVLLLFLFCFVLFWKFWTWTNTFANWLVIVGFTKTLSRLLPLRSP